MQLLNDKIDGEGSPENTLPAVEWNQVPSELQNLIENFGITLTNGDLNQLGKAVAGYVASGNLYTDSGAANAYVLAQLGTKQIHPDYEDGDLAEFVALSPSSGASTVNIAGKGVKNIKHSDGSDTQDGSIRERTLIKFDESNDWFEIVPLNIPAQILRPSSSGFLVTSSTLTAVPGMQITLYPGRIYMISAQLRFSVSPDAIIEVELERVGSGGSSTVWPLMYFNNYRLVGFNAPIPIDTALEGDIYIIPSSPIRVDGEEVITLRLAKDSGGDADFSLNQESLIVIQDIGVTRV